VLIARVYARYLVPLAVLSVISFLPLLAFALRLQPPADIAHARMMLRLAYVLAIVGWIPLLVLVGGAAAAVDGGSQLHVLQAGLAQLVRAIVPCVVAAMAIVIGGLALVVPGLALVVLLSLTGASRARGLPAPLTDSVTAVRANLGAVLTVIAVTIVVGAAIVYVTQRTVVALPLPSKPTPAQLLAFPRFVRIALGALVLAAPVPAIALAAIQRKRS
jgi:hypothetical protein